MENYGEEFLHCGKWSIKFDDNICVSDNVSNNYIEFSIKKYKIEQFPGK